MNFVSKLWRVAVLGICSTLLISVATGFVFLIDGYPSLGPDPMEGLYLFGLGFVYSLYFGGFIGLLYGVPVYTLFLHLDTFPFWALRMLAIAPGLASLFFDFAIGLFLLGGGVSFLLIVHWLAGKWPGLRPQELPGNALR